jgi:integrase
VVFARILVAAGIVRKIRKGKGEGRDTADKSFHSWRHTCNTMLANTGADIRLRQLISDHETAAMNNRYTHPQISAMADAIVKIHKSAFE